MKKSGLLVASLLLSTSSVFAESYSTVDDIFDKYSCDSLTELAQLIPTKSDFEKVAASYVANSKLYKDKLKKMRAMDPVNKDFNSTYLALGKSCSITLSNDKISLGFYSDNAAENNKVSKNTMINAFSSKGYPLDQRNIKLVKLTNEALVAKWNSASGSSCYASFRNSGDEAYLELDCYN